MWPRQILCPPAPSRVQALLTFWGAGCILALPAGSPPWPAVVLCTGFAGTHDTPAVRAASAAFAGAGFAALSFDYRGFGLSSGYPRQVPDLAGQRADIGAAIVFLQGDERMDSGRTALWGTSLGGGHVVVAAAERGDVAAVIAQVPFNGFPRKIEGRNPRGVMRLLRAMLVDRIRGYLRLSPRYIPAVGPAGSLAVMATPEAAGAVESLDSRTWRNEAPPRVLFDMMAYRPDRFSARLRAPLLVCVATGDRESPETQASRLAERAPHGRILRYPVSHFDVYRPEVRQQLLAHQTAFLTEVLLSPG